MSSRSAEIWHGQLAGRCLTEFLIGFGPVMQVHWLMNSHFIDRKRKLFPDSLEDLHSFEGVAMVGRFWTLDWQLAQCGGNLAKPDSWFRQVCITSVEIHQSLQWSVMRLPSNCARALFTLMNEWLNPLLWSLGTCWKSWTCMFPGFPQNSG